MNFDDVLLERRSIRKYLATDVSDDLIISIVEAGKLAPSAHNKQPWKIKVVNGDMKDKIVDALLNKKSLSSSITFTADVIKSAPCLIMVFYDKENCSSSRDNDILSLGAFVENMHLKAVSLGLGSLWIADTNYIKDDIRRICDVPLECISCLAIGEKNQNPKMRPRRCLEEIIIK